LVGLSALSGSDRDIIEFEASFTSGGTTVQLGRERLTRRPIGGNSKYVSGQQALTLAVPNDRVGTLHARVVTEETSHPGQERWIMGHAGIPMGLPCALREIEIVVPEAEAVRFDQRWFEAPIEEETTDGRRTYRHRFENLPAAGRESAMPHPLDSFPALLWSNVPEWTDLAGTIAAKWEPHLFVDDAMADRAAKLAGPHADSLSQALAIHNAVADGWGYLGFYPGESGWVPHDAPVCFSSRIGDCKDRSALMISMMRSVGLDAWPAVIWSGERFEAPAIPVIVANHAIVWVRDTTHPDGGFFLDSVDGGMGAWPLGEHLSDRHALVLAPDGPGLIAVPPTPAEHRLVDEQTRMVLADDGSARVSFARRLHGRRANEERADRARSGDQDWQDRLTRSLSRAVPGASATTISDGPDPGDPDLWLVEASADSTGLVQRAGDYAVLRVPWLARWGGVVYMTSRREWPRELRGEQLRWTVRIELPPGVEVAQAPHPDQQKSAPWRSTYSVTSTPGEVVVSLTVDVEGGRVGPKREEARRNFYRRVAALQELPIVLKWGGS
jgi:hypothetical protein